MCLCTELIHHAADAPREILIYPIFPITLRFYTQEVYNLIQSLYYLVSVCLHIYQCHGYIDT